MKKETRGKTWNLIKEGAAAFVGFGAASVVEVICWTHAPAETASVVQRAIFRAGTHGASLVTGAVARDLAKQEIDKYEMVSKKMLNILKSDEEPTLKAVED